MLIRQATHDDLIDVAEIFNLYRMFYQLPDDIKASTDFIRENLLHQRSEIFILIDDNLEILAFVQLYKSYDSLSLQPYYYLSDLFVKNNARGKGYSEKMMRFVSNYYREKGIPRLTLETAFDNKIAQNLYEKLGYEKEKTYLTYHQNLK